MNQSPHNQNLGKIVLAPVSQTSESTPKHLNIAYLNEISGENPEFIIDILTMFREESVEFMSKVRSQFNQKDFYSLKKTAHAMKPTGSYIGVNSLTILVTSLESASPRGDSTEVSGLINEIEKLLKKLNEEIDAQLISMRK
jgi:HPt (histidine-containing phosphotransfer) domain-containing protein